MPTYECKVKTLDGKTLIEEVDAADEKEARQKLMKKGYFIIGIKEKSGELQLFKPSVTTKDITVFARQFAVMINSGVPLVRCLSIMAEQMDNPTLRDVIRKVKTDVESGAPLSAALKAHQDIFGDLFVNLVRAGEAGGILDKILDRLADYMENAEGTRQKVKGALTYPVVVISIAILVVIFIVTFVIPQFQEIFADMGPDKLPLPTKILLSVSHFMSHNFLLVIGIIFGVVFGVKAFLSTEQGRKLFDKLLLNMPAFGELIRKASIARFTRTLGTLLSSGVPILQALEVTASTAGNTVIEEAVMRVKTSISEGESIAGPLRRTGVFPPMVIQMIAIGEETGELDKMLEKIADFYEKEVDAAVKALSSIIEPLIIVFMGLVIGGIVMAVFLPMVQMVNMSR